MLGTGEAGQQMSRQALCAQIALQLVEPDHAVGEPQERQVEPRQAARALRDQEQPFREAPMKGFEGAARLASRGRADQDHESAVAEGMVQLGVTGPPHVRRGLAGIGCAVHLTWMHPETMWIGDVTDSGAAASAQGAERVPHQPCGLSPAAEHQERGSRAWCHSLATRIANLSGNGTGTSFDQRLNGSYFLRTSGPNATVFDNASSNSAATIVARTPVIG